MRRLAPSIWSKKFFGSRFESGRQSCASDCGDVLVGDIQRHTCTFVYLCPLPKHILFLHAACAALDVHLAPEHSVASRGSIRLMVFAKVLK